MYVQPSTLSDQRWISLIHVARIPLISSSVWQVFVSKTIPPSKILTISIMNLRGGLIFQMEKYSAHLESIVSERTQDLIVEKQRTDELLHSMLFSLNICFST